MNEARAILKDYDAATRRDDRDACGGLRQRLDVIAERLPALDEEQDYDPEEHLARRFAAVPGKVPLWGQKGGFILTCTFHFGVTCRVVIRSSMDGLNASAFDWDGMFLIASGYLELYAEPVRGRTVKQAAVAAISQQRKNLRRAEPLVPLVDAIWEGGQRVEVPGEARRGRSRLAARRLALRIEAGREQIAARPRINQGPVSAGADLRAPGRHSTFANPSYRSPASGG